MPQLAAQLFENNAFLFAIGGEIHMAALTRQAHPALINVYQMSNAQPGTGTVDGNRLAFHRFRAAKLNQMFSF